jgi:hypothetical protein
MQFDQFLTAPRSAARTAFVDVEHPVHRTPADRCDGHRAEATMQAAPCDAPGCTCIAPCFAT